MCHVVDVDGIYYHCKHCYIGTSPLCSVSVQTCTHGNKSWSFQEGRKQWISPALKDLFTPAVNGTSDVFDVKGERSGTRCKNVNIYAKCTSL